MLPTGNHSLNRVRSKQVSRLNQSLNFAHRNWAKPINLNHLADSACLSKYHYSRLFQRYTGETPLHLLNRIRLENCAHLLSYRNEWRINQIALNCGFSSQQAFSRAFSRHFDSCPRSFRAQFMENLEAALPEDQANEYAEPRVVEEGDAWSERAINKIRQTYIPSIRVAYFRNIGSYGISDGIDHSIASIRHWAQKYALWQGDSRLIGASWDSNKITPNLYCKYDACLQIPEDFRADHEVSIQRIPAGEYAIYRRAYQSTGEISLIWREFTQCVRSRRFSAYRMSSKPCFEIFSTNPLSGQSEIELYVRLIRKQSALY